MPLAQSTRTVLEVQTAVKRQFGDESGTQITDTDILRWINQAQTNICNRGEVNKTSATTPSVAGQDTYTIAGTNIFKILAITYANRPLEGVSFEQSQATLSNISASNFLSAPETWYEYDDSIVIYPTPIASGDVIKLYIIAAPVAVTASGNTLSIPDTHYDALLQYVLQQAYELDDDFGSASVKAQQHETTMEGLMSTASYRTYPTITVLAEDA